MMLSMLWAAIAPMACVHPPLTVTARREAVAAIGRRAGERVRPSDISDAIDGGRWRLVWAIPANAERGVFFLRRDRAARWHFVEVWGGVIAPGERAATVAWARRRGGDFPPALARCFADALLASE